MTKVITYGTYDLLHYGHKRLLERAKALGDYLIVGVTSDDYDKTRGKINNQQSLMERIAAVRATGLADEIIVEEYEGQKIDDIRRYGVDIFTVGSDWEGKFDYLNKFCKVVYLPRTEGVSSSEIRAEQRKIRMGLVGESVLVQKVQQECSFVNGGIVAGVYSADAGFSANFDPGLLATDYDTLLRRVDAVYLASHPSLHYTQIKTALLQGKHVLCESPIAETKERCDELFALAASQGCILMDAIKTAYATAYNRLMLLLKSGKIGKVVSVDATCTSLADPYLGDAEQNRNRWNSICAWGPTAMLPVFQIFGTEYVKKQIVTLYADTEKTFDQYTKITFIYPQTVATISVGKGVKAEGQMVISGTNGYLYVPAPWWKTDYFEVRYENPNENKRYFYQLDGEGIRHELVVFLEAIQKGYRSNQIPQEVSAEICQVIQDMACQNDTFELSV